MSKRDPLDPEKAKTKWTEISEDELEARMQRQREMRDIPAQKAVEIIEDALAKVLRSIGINTDSEPDSIELQKEFLGISVYEMPEGTRLPSGFYIYTDHEKFNPYAWVGDAHINSMSEIVCQIHWFRTEQEEIFGGVKIITK